MIMLCNSFDFIATKQRTEQTLRQHTVCNGGLVLSKYADHTIKSSARTHTATHCSGYKSHFDDPMSRIIVHIRDTSFDTSISYG